MKYFRKLAAGLVFGAGMAATAFAQTANAPIGGGRTMESISASEIQAMLADFQINSELRGAQRVGGAPVIVATTGGGAKFLVGLQQCADAAQGVGCRQAMITTMHSSAGVVFEDLNQFNGRSSVTTAVYDPNNQILIFGRNIFMPGGVGRDNFKLQVALFLNDMTKFVAGQSTSAASVAFNRSPNLRSKISSVTADADAPNPLLMSAGAAIEKEIAISNATGVDYSVDVALPGLDD